MYEDAKRYSDYIKNYLSSLNNNIEICVFPIITEDGLQNVKISLIDLKRKRAVNFIAFVPEEKNWQFSLACIKSRANKEFGYTVLF